MIEIKKNLCVYNRFLLVRKEEKKFIKVCKWEILQNYTPEQQAEFEKSINYRLKNKFEKFAEIDLSKKNCVLEFLSAIARYKNLSPSFQNSEFLNNIYQETINYFK